MGARLHRPSFLAAYQAMVSGLAADLGDARRIDSGARACRLRLRRKPDPARCAKSGLPRGHPRKRARNAGDDRPSLAHGVGRARHLCRSCFTAICRSWRAQLCLPHGSAPSADPRQWTHDDDVARRDGARDTARQWHPARFGMRRSGALYHLPHPRSQWASGAARTGWTGSRGASAHRGDGRCAARLPDSAYGRYFGDATACCRLQRRRWPRARRHGGERTPGHGRVHRPARLHHARRGADASSISSSTR